MADTETKPGIHVAYCVDIQGQGAAQFCDQLIVSAASLRAANKMNRIFVHLVFANAPAGLISRLHDMETPDFRVIFHLIQPDDLAALQQYTNNLPNSAVRTWSGIVYARMFLSQFLEGVGRAIYLDADTLVQGDIAPLFDCDLGGKLFGMVMGCVPEYGYNSGVMLQDLDEMRKRTDLLVALGNFMKRNSRTFLLPDQTTINRFFADDIVELEKKWNFPPTPGARDPAMDEAVILHFYNQHEKPHRIPRDDVGKAFIAWNNVLVDMEASL